MATTPHARAEATAAAASGPVPPPDTYRGFRGRQQVATVQIPANPFPALPDDPLSPFPGPRSLAPLAGDGRPDAARAAGRPEGPRPGRSGARGGRLTAGPGGGGTGDRGGGRRKAVNGACPHPGNIACAQLLIRKTDRDIPP